MEKSITLIIHKKLSYETGSFFYLPYVIVLLKAMYSITDLKETIVAIATPPGIGAIGVIRLSGNRSIEIINSVFKSKDLSLQPSHTLHVGILKMEDDIIDEVGDVLFYINETLAAIECSWEEAFAKNIIKLSFREKYGKDKKKERELQLAWKQ